MRQRRLAWWCGGQRREDSAEVSRVVEISWGGGSDDVERAVRRAALLAQTGTQTMPVVAGQSITADAAELSRAMRVWQVLDGQVIAPEAVYRTDWCGDSRQGSSASPPVAYACQPVFHHAPHGWLPAQPAGGHQDVAS